jgi:hypothetical protein
MVEPCLRFSTALLDFAPWNGNNHPRKMRSIRMGPGFARPITGETMKKQILVAAAAALFALSAVPANADWTWPWSVRDPRLATSNFVVGVGATAGYFALRHHHRGAGWNGGIHSAAGAYALTSIGCAAVSPIVGTIVVQRPLTQREVGVSTANCFLPFVGGWLVNAAWDAHPEWSGPPPRRRR